MKTKEIRNGCLYYNTLTKRVERAIGKVGRRVMTMVHDQDTKLVKSDNFRRASRLQVDNYLSHLTKKSTLKNALKRVATLKLF
jgi:hypothetical protein